MNRRASYIQELEKEFGVKCGVEGFDRTTAEGEKAHQRLVGWAAGYAQGYDDAIMED